MNVFLEANRKRINDMYYHLEEFKIKNTADGMSLDINGITFIIKGLCREIESLQKEKDELNEKLKLYDGMTK